MVIIYKTESGFTKEYAKMVSTELNIPCSSIDDIAKYKTNEIVFMTWLMAGTLQGYKKLKKLNIKAVLAVGMDNGESPKQLNDLKTKYPELNNKIFYAQGGFDLKKLSGIHKFMMRFVARSMQNKPENLESKTKAEIEMFEMLTKGKNCVSRDKINEFVEFIK